MDASTFPKTTDQGIPPESPPRAPQNDTPQPTDGDSDSDSSDEEEEQVELMVTTRQKRTTAGNRMIALLQQEEEQQEEDPEDDLALLFQEDGAEDEGFEDAEGDSDVQMDSDDDDDDDAAVGDDLEGEKALERQEKAERQAKKRKLNDGIPKIFKKKVKIDPTAATGPRGPAPRPKKKSERASWIPTVEDAPTRASNRGTTRQSKEQLHVQMVDRELKRLKQLKNMEKAAAAKEAKKKPALTQADRLAEAARIEKANAKSLSRWEEAEMQREADQLAKLAALKNRHLEGPFITWWSGMAEWFGGKLRQVGKNLIIEEPKEKPAIKKRKAAEMEEEDSIEVHDGRKPESALPPASRKTEDADATSTNGQKEGKTDSKSPPPPSISEPSETPPLPEPPIIPIQPLPPRSSVLAPPPGLPIQAPHPPPNMSNGQLHPPFLLAPPAFDGSSPLPGFGYNPHQYPRPPPMTTGPQMPLSWGFNAPPPPPFHHTHTHTKPPTPPLPPPPPLPPSPPKLEHATRNYLILQNFDETAIKDKVVQTEVIFGRKFTKMPTTKHKPACCAITSYPARYRDPSTGLTYSNSFAYKEIQKLKEGEYRWSKLVGAYVGPKGFAARGVPERFLNPAWRPMKEIMMGVEHEASVVEKAGGDVGSVGGQVVS